MTDWVEETINIGDLPHYLNNYEVETDSPDGWVPVLEFVDKGEWEEYFLCFDENMYVRCNENHLFETSLGWSSAKEIYLNYETKDVLPHIITVDGLRKPKFIQKLDHMIPIVDLQIGHPNHRYYANGISSHNTSGGKSLAMCHMAANNLSDGRNVLYITLEMAEEKIAKRIDANLFDIAIADIDGMVRGSYLRKVDQFASKTNGKLIVKEYPPTSAGANHFRHLLNELKLKRNFFPDIIYIDYLNLCVSSRFKNNSNMGPYQYVKAISEELRGLAIEYDFPVVSATQTNRGGYGNTDVGLEDVSESFGLPMTADIMMAVINNDEFKAEGKLLFKQLKNRDGDTTYHNSFFVGVDYSRMRLYDLDDQEQEQSTNEDRPIMDDTTFGKADFDRKKKRGFDFDKFK